MFIYCIITLYHVTDLFYAYYNLYAICLVGLGVSFWFKRVLYDGFGGVAFFYLMLIDACFVHSIYHHQSLL